MTKADLLAAYADAKEQVEFQPPTRIRPRCKWRVTKFICGEMGTLKLYPESKKSWIHRGGLWYWSTKAEVAKILEGYGLTVEDFITAALQTFWLDFEARGGDTEPAYLKKRFPYAFNNRDYK